MAIYHYYSYLSNEHCNLLMLTLGGENVTTVEPCKKKKKKLSSQPMGAFVLTQLKKHTVSIILVCREER